MALGGTGIFHPRWSEHHRPTATTAMTSACQISRATGDGATDPDTGDWEPSDPDTVYSGPCRAQALANDRLEVAGEAQQTARRYLVAIPYGGDVPQLDDTVTFTASDGDTDLIGIQLRVVDVRLGSQAWERDLIAEEIEP